MILWMPRSILRWWLYLKCSTVVSKPPYLNVEKWKRSSKFMNDFINTVQTFSGFVRSLTKLICTQMERELNKVGCVEGEPKTSFTSPLGFPSVSESSLDVRRRMCAIDEQNKTDKVQDDDRKSRHEKKTSSSLAVTSHSLISSLTVSEVDSVIENQMNAKSKRRVAELPVF